MSSPHRPRYSVIIPAYNAADVLPECLRSLAQQTIATDGEVIVSDDGSTDDTIARARSVDVPSLRIVGGPHRGKSKARNWGLRAAQGEIVLFTDADCVPAPDWAEQMLSVFDCPAVAGARGVYRTRQPELVARFVQAEFEEKYRCLAAFQARHGCVEFADTYSTAYRRDVLNAIGGFDESFVGAEDAELSFRVVAHGYRLVFVSDGVVFHRHPTRLGDYLTRKASYAFWRARVFRRYPDRMARDSYTPRVVPLQMFLALLLAASVVASLGIAIAAGPRAARLAAATGASALVAFVAATLPFASRQAKRDPGLALTVLPLVLARALVQGVALPVGLVNWAVHHVGPVPNERHD